MAGIAVVTGASRGIGKHTAVLLREEGFDVIGTYNLGRKEAMEMESRGIAMRHLDLSDVESIKAFASSIKALDVLVNNAAVISWKRFREQSIEEISQQLDVNLKGTIILTRLLMGKVRKVVANVASGAGKTAYPSLSVYCATKFGLRGFTQSLAMEHPSLRIFSFNPGMTATRMTGFQGEKPERVARILVDAILGRIGPDSNYDVDVWDYL